MSNSSLCWLRVPLYLLVFLGMLHAEAGRWKWDCGLLDRQANHRCKASWNRTTWKPNCNWSKWQKEKMLGAVCKHWYNSCKMGDKTSVFIFKMKESALGYFIPVNISFDVKNTFFLWWPMFWIEQKHCLWIFGSWMSLCFGTCLHYKQSLCYAFVFVCNWYVFVICATTLQGLGVPPTYHRTGNYWISLVLNHHFYNFHLAIGTSYQITKHQRQ